MACLLKLQIEPTINKSTLEKKMKVEIWSDVMCPFCYIGKRKFEAALSSFPQKDSSEVIWHSFQLNPNLQYQPDRDTHAYLSGIKGQTRKWSVRIHENLAQSAKSIGLDFNFDAVKITNTFDAHRVIQLAKNYHLANETEERFFKAYFTDGELMSDHSTLSRLSAEVGLPQDEVTNLLKTNLYAEEVRNDCSEAQRLGVSGVPFFVIDRKYAVSGAQDTSVFSNTLQKAMAGWKENNRDIFHDVLNG
jgi:predicted DsbA family dithiol-disulfide isomerase